MVWTHKPDTPLNDGPPNQSKSKSSQQRGKEGATASIGQAVGWGNYGRPPDGTAWELLFNAVALPPLGFKTFFVTVNPSSTKSASSVSAISSVSASGGDISIENQHIRLVFNSSSGELRQIQEITSAAASDDRSPRKGDIVHSIKQQLVVYDSNRSVSDNYKFLPSGPAIDIRSKCSSLLPASESPTSKSSYADARNAAPALSVPIVSVVRGPVVSEVRIQWAECDWAEQRFRLTTLPSDDHNNSLSNRGHSSGATRGASDYTSTLSVSHTIGPLPVEIEVASRFMAPDFAEDGAFWSDESGWFMQHRHYNSTKEADPSANVAANFYPLFGTAFVRDGNDKQLTVLAAHSHGMTGGTPNVALEVMLHRRLDSGHLNDTSVVTSHFDILIGSVASSTLRRHHARYELQRAPVLLFGGATTSEEWLQLYLGSLLTLDPTAAFPSDRVHILNLDVWNWDEKVLLLRFMHLYENGEKTSDGEDVGAGDASPPQPAAFDISKLFHSSIFKVQSCEERGLSVVFPASMPPRWRRASNSPTDSSAVSMASDCQVVLSPLDIKTFLVRIA
jgi:hypothetical protein